MAEAKTLPTGADTAAFVAAIEDRQKREDSVALINLMGEITGQPAMMWGSSIIGFARYHYRSASGHEGDTFILGFSPRKQNLTLYLPGYLDQYPANLFAQLGKHSVGKGCVYVKRLSDVDLMALVRLLEAGVRWHRTANPSVT